MAWCDDPNDIKNIIKKLKTKNKNLKENAYIEKIINMII